MYIKEYPMVWPVWASYFGRLICKIRGHPKPTRPILLMNDVTYRFFCRRCRQWLYDWTITK